MLQFTPKDLPARNSPFLDIVRQKFVSRVEIQDFFKHCFLKQPCLCNVLQLNRKTVPLGGLDVAMTGQLLNHMDGEFLGPIGDAGSSQIMYRKGTHTCSPTKGFKPSQDIVDQISVLFPATSLNFLAVIVPSPTVHKNIRTTIRGNTLPRCKQADNLVRERDAAHLMVFGSPWLNKALA